MKILAYKVFRIRILTVTVVILSGAALLLFILYRFIWNEQLNGFNNQSAELNQSIERILRREQQWITLGMNDIYSSNALTSDMFFMFQSASIEEYLRLRLEKSVSVSERLRSFPEYFHSRVRIQESSLKKLILREQGYENVLSFTGNTTGYAFRESGFPEDGSVKESIIFRQTVYNLSSRDDAQSSIDFYFDAGRLLNSLPIKTGTVSAAVLTDGQGGAYFLTGRDAYTPDVITNAAGRESGSGQLDIEPGRVYYNNFDYEYLPYRLTVMTDAGYFLNGVRDWLIIATAGVSAAAFGLIALFIFNAREDRAFLHRIYESIGTMKRGVFGAVMPVPKKYRSNEYGEIAKELDDMSGRLQKYIQTEYELKIKQHEAEMNSLLNQISPHFLYNTLEVIRSRAILNADSSTSDSIAALGLFYRSFMQTPEFCAVNDELNLLEIYLKLISFRFPNQFFYQISADPEFLALPTVKAWMQPLAENFIIHGFDKKSEYNLLLISGTPENGGFRMEITDNGKKIQEEKVKRMNGEMVKQSEKKTVGLSNVYGRLRLFYGEKFRMKLYANPEGGIRVSIFLPGGKKEASLV